MNACNAATVRASCGSKGCSYLALALKRGMPSLTQRQYEPLPEARGPLSGVARSTQEAALYPTTNYLGRGMIGCSRIRASEYLSS